MHHATMQIRRDVLTLTPVGLAAFLLLSAAATNATQRVLSRIQNSRSENRIPHSQLLEVASTSRSLILPYSFLCTVTTSTPILFFLSRPLSLDPSLTSQFPSVSPFPRSSFPHPLFVAFPSFLLHLLLACRPVFFFPLVFSLSHSSVASLNLL